MFLWPVIVQILCYLTTPFYVVTNHFFTPTIDAPPTTTTIYHTHFAAVTTLSTFFPTVTALAHDLSLQSYTKHFEDDGVKLESLATLSLVIFSSFLAIAFITILTFACFQNKTTKSREEARRERREQTDREKMDLVLLMIQTLGDTIHQRVDAVHEDLQVFKTSQTVQNQQNVVQTNGEDAEDQAPKWLSRELFTEMKTLLEDLKQERKEFKQERKQERKEIKQLRKGLQDDRIALSDTYNTRRRHTNLLEDHTNQLDAKVKGLNDEIGSFPRKFNTVQSNLRALEREMAKRGPKPVQDHRVIDRKVRLGTLEPGFHDQITIPTKPTADIVAFEEPVDQITTPTKPTADIVAPEEPVDQVTTPTKPIADIVTLEEPVDQITTPTKPTADIVAPEEPVDQVTTPIKPATDIMTSDEPPTPIITPTPVADIMESKMPLAHPTTSNTVDPTTSSTADPLTSGTLDPTTSGDTDPTESRTVDPTTSSMADPITSSVADPNTSSLSNPKTSSGAVATSSTINHTSDIVIRGVPLVHTLHPNTPSTIPITIKAGALTKKQLGKARRVYRKDGSKARNLRMQKRKTKQLPNIGLNELRTRKGARISRCGPWQAQPYIIDIKVSAFSSAQYHDSQLDTPRNEVAVALSPRDTVMGENTPVPTIQFGPTASPSAPPPPQLPSSQPPGQREDHEATSQFTPNLGTAPPNPFDPLGRFGVTAQSATGPGLTSSLLPLSTAPPPPPQVPWSQTHTQRGDHEATPQFTPHVETAPQNPFDPLGRFGATPQSAPGDVSSFSHPPPSTAPPPPQLPPGHREDHEATSQPSINPFISTANPNPFEPREPLPSLPNAGFTTQPSATTNSLLPQPFGNGPQTSSSSGEPFNPSMPQPSAATTFSSPQPSGNGPQTPPSSAPAFNPSLPQQSAPVLSTRAPSSDPSSAVPTTKPRRILKPKLPKEKPLQWEKQIFDLDLKKNIRGVLVHPGLPHEFDLLLLVLDYEEDRTDRKCVRGNHVDPEELILILLNFLEAVGVNINKERRDYHSPWAEVRSEGELLEHETCVKWMTMMANKAWHFDRKQRLTKLFVKYEQTFLGLRDILPEYMELDEPQASFPDLVKDIRRAHLHRFAPR